MVAVSVAAFVFKKTQRSSEAGSTFLIRLPCLAEYGHQLRGALLAMKTALICLICLIYIKWLIHDFSGEVEKDPCSNLDKLHDFSSLLPFVCGWYVEFLIDLSVRNTTKHTKNTKKFQANDLSIQKRIGFQRIKHHPLDVSISLRSASRPKWTRTSGCIITIPSAQAEAEARHRCVKNCKFDAWKMKMDANCRHDSPWKIRVFWGV